MAQTNPQYVPGVGPLQYTADYLTGRYGPWRSGLDPETEQKIRASLIGQLQELQKKRDDQKLAYIRLGREIIDSQAQLAATYAGTLGVLTSAVADSIRSKAMSEKVGADILAQLGPVTTQWVADAAGTPHEGADSFKEAVFQKNNDFSNNFMNTHKKEFSRALKSAGGTKKAEDLIIANAVNNFINPLSPQAQHLMKSTRGSSARVVHSTGISINDTVYTNALVAVRSIKNDFGAESAGVDEERVAREVARRFSDSNQIENAIIETETEAEAIRNHAANEIQYFVNEAKEHLNAGMIPSKWMKKMDDSLVMLEDLINMTPEEAAAGVAGMIPPDNMSEIEEMIRAELEKLGADHDPLNAAITQMMLIPGMPKLVAAMGFTSARRAAVYLSNPVRQYMVFESLATIQEMGDAPLNEVRDELLRRSSDEEWKFYVRPIERATRIRIQPHVKEHHQRVIKKNRELFRKKNPNAPVVLTPGEVALAREPLLEDVPEAPPAPEPDVAPDEPDVAPEPFSMADIEAVEAKVEAEEAAAAAELVSTEEFEKDLEEVLRKDERLKTGEDVKEEARQKRVDEARQAMKDTAVDATTTGTLSHKDLDNISEILNLGGVQTVSEAFKGGYDQLSQKHGIERHLASMNAALDRLPPPSTEGGRKGTVQNRKRTEAEMEILSAYGLSSQDGDTYYFKNETTGRVTPISDRDVPAKEEPAEPEAATAAPAEPTEPAVEAVPQTKRQARKAKRKAGRGSIGRGLAAMARGTQG